MIDTNKFKTRKSLIIAGMVVIGLLGILAAKEAHAAPFVIHSAMLGPISVPSQPASPPQVATFRGPIIGRATTPPVNFSGPHELNGPIVGRVVIPNTPPVNIGSFHSFHGPIIAPGMIGFVHRNGVFVGSVMGQQREFIYAPPTKVHLPMFG